MSEDRAYFVAFGTPNPDHPQAMQDYVAQAGALNAAAGGERVGRFGFAEGLVGDGFPGFVVVMAFPTKQAITDAFASDAYAALTPLREKGFKDLKVFIVDALP